MSTWDNASEALAEDGRRKDRRIAELEEANEQLAERLRATKRELASQVKALTEQLERSRLQHQEEKAKILKLSALESELNAKALEKSLAEIDHLNGQIFSLKYVLRTPRLARMFQDLYRQVPSAEQLGARLR